MSQALTTVDPKWTAVLSTIPLDLIDARDHPRLIRTLEGVAQCENWGDIATTGGLSRPEFMMLKRRSKEFASLAKEAEAIANDIRHDIREQEAHDRAVKGEMTPTVDKNGSIVDWYPKRSDKLLELLLKAADPKYKDSKAGESGGGRVVLQVSFGIPSRISQPAIIDMEEIVDDDRSRTLKSPDEDAGHHAGPAPTGSETAGADAERDPDGRQIQGGCAGTPGNGDGGGNNSGGREGDRLCGHPGKKDPEDKAKDGPGAPAKA
jgi:hypothetical protein